MILHNRIGRGMAVATVIMACALPALEAENLVIVQTNDTHSQIDPNDKNLGGVKRRLALVDSIRAENPHTLLIDTGDAVQGTLFFTVYGGEVETKMMNELGYDIAILGNHDFDNGVASLAGNLANSKVEWITTNYDITDSELSQYFKPYTIKEIDGKRIAFIGINLVPKGMISEGNYDGVVYLDGIKAANATAWHLKHNEKVDMVIALTHVGYEHEVAPLDVDIAAASEDIDIILGGHSHTNIVPGSGKEWVKNALGKDVLITQNAKGGVTVSEVTIDLDKIGSALPSYRQVAIDSRLDERAADARYARIDSILAPYRTGVDDVMLRPIGQTAKALDANEPPLLNFISDFALERGNELAPGVHLAIMNRGGIRRDLPKGTITEGEIINMQPFNNRIVVLDINGADLLDAFAVMASRGGDGVSKGVSITFDADTHKLIDARLNGHKIDPDATYRIATIDYLANGGDYMEPLTKGTEITRSPNVVYRDLISYIQDQFKHKKINPHSEMRMKGAK